MVARDYGAGSGRVGWQQKEGSWGDGIALYLQCLHPGSDTVLEFYKIEPWGKSAMYTWESLYYFLQLLCVIIRKSKSDRRERKEEKRKEGSRGKKRGERETERSHRGPRAQALGFWAAQLRTHHFLL